MPDIALSLRLEGTIPPLATLVTDDGAELITEAGEPLILEG